MSEGINLTKLYDAEQPTGKGLDETICSPSSGTPETTTVLGAILYKYGTLDEYTAPEEWVKFARKMEVSMRKLHVAYRQKVQGEIQLGHYDKGALTLLAEIQREYPSLSENAKVMREGASEG